MVKWSTPMKYFFVQDYRQKYRFFSSEPIQNIQVKFTRLEKLWEEAKKRLMLLPKRILAQEQAFARALKLNEDSVEILHSGRLDEKRLKIKFFLFLQKQRTKHILLLVGEAILLPVSGLLALLPGPNVFFGVLALIMFTHWQALKGINKISRKSRLFITSRTLNEWEQALLSQERKNLTAILDKIEEEYNLKDIKKILYK
ncbi:MAG: hypothetical protein KAT01_11820 [Candidatus Aminicenantes bacterium]|nr:hypothetical protein [Candidatus Aminicenantes bacterium]